MKQNQFENLRIVEASHGPTFPLLPTGSSQSVGMRNVTETENGPATLLRRYRKAVILIFSLFVVAACIYTELAPKSYKVQTTLQLQGLNQDFMNTHDVSQTTNGVIDPTYIETQIRLMQNEGLTERVVKTMTTPSGPGASPAAKESVVRRILNSEKVKEEGSSNLVSISMEGPDPHLTANTANQLAQQYIEDEQNARVAEANETDTFLLKQLDDAKAKLQNAEDALQGYAHDSGIVLTSDSQEPVATEHLREVQQGLAQAQVDLAARQAQLDVARHSDGETLPEVVNDPVIREDTNKLRDLRVQLADLSTTMTPENYKVQQIQSEVQDLEKEMALHRSIIVERLSSEQNEASRRAALLEGQYRRDLATATDQGSKQVHFNMLRNEVDINREIYQTMVQKAKEAGMMAALRTPNARIVSAADAPILPSSPNLPVSLALSILLAAVTSLLYVVVSERRNRSLRVPGETEVFLPNAELAAIPEVQMSGRRLVGRTLALKKSGEQKGHPMLEHWSNREGDILSEAFRMASTSILLRTNGDPESKVLLVTSPHAQCGKTMSSANLAISLGEGSKKVLVIDGDLRKAGLSHLFGFENSPGLSESLSDSRKEDPFKLIQTTEFRGVWVLPSGTAQENAAKLLQSERLRMVIEIVRPDFDYILLDGPPLSSSPMQGC